MLTSTQVLQSLSNAGAQVKETTDTRSMLQRLRKSGLYRLLRANGHDVDENMDHEKMMHYAQAYEDKLDFSKVTITPDGFGGISVKKPIEHVMEERAFNEEVQKEKKSLSEMKRADLLKLMKEKGLAVDLSLTKEQCIEALSGENAS